MDQESEIETTGFIHVQLAEDGGSSSKQNCMKSSGLSGIQYTNMKATKTVIMNDKHQLKSCLSYEH